jgi:DNA-binding IclR family transcriptional regulator
VKETNSASVDRVVDLLQFLAGHPDRPWSHAELSRELGTSATTLHTLLLSLTEHRLLLRTDDKRYRLGPGILTLAGGVVGEAWRAWDVARHRVEHLARRLELAVYCSTLVGDELVVVGRVLPPGRADQIIRPVVVGSSRPFTPPLGRVFVAWADAETQQRWLAKADGRAAGETSRPALEASLTRLRRDGFDVTLMGQPKAELLAALATLDDAANEALHGVYDFVGRLDPSMATTADVGELGEGAHHVHSLTAPVFGPGGAVLLAVAINAFPTPLSKASIQHVAGDLLDTTRAIATEHAARERTS